MKTLKICKDYFPITKLFLIVNTGYLKSMSTALYFYLFQMNIVLI